VQPRDHDALIARIAEKDIKLNAWRAFSDHSALNSSRIGDFYRRTGMLEGVTVGVKDIIDVEGLPTRNGSPIFEHAPPALRDATVVARMREAGAIIVGKTVTTELATFVPASTRNPRDHTRTPGGSSSGSAAAVAAGHVDIAIGTQTAGSIIRPAAYCGVVGFKPSFGLIPTDGVLRQCPSLDTVGVFARDLHLIERWLVAVTADSLPQRDANQVARKKPQRFGLIPSTRAELAVRPSAAGMDSSENTENAEMLRRTRVALEGDGHQVAAIALPASLRAVSAHQKIVQDFEAARTYAPLLDRHRGQIDPNLVEVLEAGLAVEQSRYDGARHAIDAAKTAVAQLFKEFDALVMPSSTGYAPIGLASTGDPSETRFASALGLPALSIPVVLRDQAGSTLGLQLVGAANGDISLIGVARTSGLGA
jgi:Asp-tRNA(Asn)/Glu-tRNA(Gln) amidotransferase A subunit family amidase